MNISKSSKTNNLISNNNANNNVTKSNSNNKINNYFHKLSGKINTNNNNINNTNKMVMSKYKSGVISNSVVSKDINKNNSFKYNGKLKKSFEAIKHP